MGLKFLLLVVVLALAVGWIYTRSRRARKASPPVAKAPVRPVQGDTTAATAAMVVCAHCQVHLPQDEAQFDVAGKPYCNADHRIAGPR